MNVSLPPELEALVAQKVKSGLYQSANEVIRDALQLLEERDRLYTLRLKELRSEVKKGLDQLDRGEGIPAEQVFKELRAKARARRRERG